MPTPKAPWRIRLEEVLADGDWHHLDDLARSAGPLVPEGKAVRRAERNRARTAEREGRTLGERTDRDTAVAAGRRDIIRRTLDAMVRHHQATKAHDEYRMRPRSARP